MKKIKADNSYGSKTSARFGEIKIKGNRVSSFREKPQTSAGWINGGFFILQIINFFNYIKNDETILRKSFRKSL